MNTTKELIVKFLQDEFRIENDNYQKLLDSQCNVLMNKAKMFRGMFQGVDSNGYALIKFSYKNKIPRPNSSSQYIIFLSEQLRKKGAVDNYTYRKILSEKKYYIEGKLLFSAMDNSTPDNQYFIARYSIQNIEDLDLTILNSFRDCFVYLGEAMPPFDMLKNLEEYSRNHDDNLFFQYDYWSCTKSECVHTLDMENVSPSKLISKCDEQNTLIIQGPPGSGKTYLIASIAKEIAEQNKSVLITTLANRALIEVVNKENIKELYNQRRLYKKVLSSEEKKNNPFLQKLSDIIPQKGQVHLSTYFSASGSPLLKNDNLTKYDYVIVDEAGQALLPFLAASLSLGRKQIFIGDNCQLPPVIELNEDQINKRKYYFAVNGMAALSKVMDVYQLTKTYRLNPHSASCTQVFYKNNLVSKGKYTDCFNLFVAGAEYRFIPGTYLICIDDFIYKEQKNNLIVEICSQLNDYHPDKDKRKKARVAVISYRVNEVTDIHKNMIFNLKINTDRFTVDTIHRCQGLTAHFALYVIDTDDVNIKYQLFNVATSRAEIATFIIAPESKISMITEKNSSMCEFISLLYKKQHAIFIRQPMSTL